MRPNLGMPSTSVQFALVVALFAGRACATTTQSSGVVQAPTEPAAPSPSTSTTQVDPTRAVVSGDASAPGDDVDAGAPARFRACNADADCIAVPRVGCCHNGWNEAVAVSQKDAYAASFVCPEAHPICAMFIVRDTRAAVCDRTTHLCTLVPGQ
jgi:hypothetical protein